MPLKSERYARELLLLSQVDPTSFPTVTDAGDAAIDALISKLPYDTRMALGVHAYTDFGVTVSRAAEIAQVPYDDMSMRLGKDGVRQDGRRRPRESI